MKRILNRLYYLTESLFARSATSQLFCVVVVVVGLSVGGGVLVHLFQPQAHETTSDAVWWAFLRLTDPGYLGDDQGLASRVISTALTLAGYVVFLGALVAIMTNALNRLMALLASGRSGIYEQDHLVIIGWNQRLHALIEELINSSERNWLSPGSHAVAVLADPFEPGMRRDLMQRLDPSVRGRCRILVRSGDPLEAESLQRVDVAHARAVIILAGEGVCAAERRAGDILAAKVLLGVAEQCAEFGTAPDVVVETSSAANAPLLRSVAGPGRLELVTNDDFLGRLFSQTLRFPGLSRVHRRLLTDSYSDAIVLRPADHLSAVGKTVGDLVGRLEEGTVMGAFRQGDEEADLLGTSYRLGQGDLLVLAVPAQPSTRSEAPQGEAICWQPVPPTGEPKKVLCVGQSPFLAALLGELASHPRERYQILLLWEQPSTRDEARLRRLEQAAQNLELEFGVGDLVDIHEVRRLCPERFDSVLLLADQAKEAPLSDAETILAYTLLDRYMQEKGAAPNFVLELNVEDNRPLIKGRDVDVIMSAELVSHFLAQVAIDEKLAWTYEELFTEEGSELRLRGLGGFAETSLTFGACQQACLARGVIAIGIRRPDDLVIHPSAGEKLRPDDRLITVEWSEPGEGQTAAQIREEEPAASRGATGKPADI